MRRGLKLLQKKNSPIYFLLPESMPFHSLQSEFLRGKTYPPALESGLALRLLLPKNNTMKWHCALFHVLTWCIPRHHANYPDTVCWRVRHTKQSCAAPVVPVKWVGNPR